MRPASGIGRLLLLMTIIASVVHVTADAQQSAGDLVIAQIYAGGQSSDAPFASDFVVLVNRGHGTASLSGWTLQYAAASGERWRTTSLAGTVPAGGAYLIGCILQGPTTQ